MRILTGIVALTLVLAPLGPALADGSQPKFTPAAGEFVPPKPKDGFRYPDCFCTDSTGARVEIGRTTCLKIGSQRILAKCGMSLNNPTWRHLQKGCPDVTS